MKAKIIALRKERTEVGDIVVYWLCGSVWRYFAAELGPIEY